MTDETALTKALIEQQVATIAAQKQEIARLNLALLEADEAGKASYSAGYSAVQAEIADLREELEVEKEIARSWHRGYGLAVDQNAKREEMFLAEIAHLTTALAGTQEELHRVKNAYEAHLTLKDAEIARLNAVITDLNTAWHADRAKITGHTPLTLDGDRAIYELHEADKARS